MKFGDIRDLNFVKRAVELARKSDRQIYLVGGSVRDVLLKRDVKDIDIVVSGDLSTWIHRLAQELKTRVVTMGKEAFFSYRLPLGEWTLDVWELKRATLEEDAWRRDFTINAIYYDLLDERIIDPANGQKDMKRKLIRMLSLTTLQDDPVRILRAVRFKVTLSNFAIDRGTFNMLAEFRHLLSRMPGERINHELELILTSASPYEGLLLLNETGILEDILPEITALKGVSQNNYHPDDVFNHTMNCIGILKEVQSMMGDMIPAESLTAEDRKVLLHALLFHDVGKPACKTIDDEDDIHFYNHEKVSKAITQSLSRRLRWSKLHTERVCDIILSHLKPTHLLLAGCPEKGVRRLIHRIGKDLPLLVLHFLADRFSRGYDETALHCAKEIVEIYHTCREEVIEPVKLVSGGDVIEAMGLRPGPEVGKILSSIVRRQVEGEISTREEALEILKSLKERNDKD